MTSTLIKLRWEIVCGVLDKLHIRNNIRLFFVNKYILRDKEVLDIE